MKWLKNHKIEYPKLPDESAIAEATQASNYDRVRALSSLSYVADGPDTGFATQFLAFAGFAFGGISSLTAFKVFQVDVCFLIIFAFAFLAMAVLVAIGILWRGPERKAAWAKTWATAIREYSPTPSSQSEASTDESVPGTSHGDAGNDSHTSA